MALKTFKFGIGEGYQEISLPEEHILQVIEGNEVPKLDDVQAATIEALRNPINSKPLQEVVSKGEKVAVIVSDITRGWIRTPEFLKYVIDEINLGGVPDEDICIVIAQEQRYTSCSNQRRGYCSLREGSCRPYQNISARLSGGGSGACR